MFRCEAGGYSYESRRKDEEHVSNLRNNGTAITEEKLTIFSPLMRIHHRYRTRYNRVNSALRPSGASTASKRYNRYKSRISPVQACMREKKVLLVRWI
jgi:hypothetical protein